MNDKKCDHCHLTFSKEVMIYDNELNFCCKGCQGVYHLLKDNDLDSFYNKLGNKTISPPINVSDDVNRFDTTSFEDIFVNINEDGFKEVDLIIEGIHCAACIWLNEKVLYNMDGIISADINFTNNKAKIIWNYDKIDLSQIISKIRSIGYNAYAYDASLADEKASKAKREYFIRMLVAVFASMNIMMLSVGKYTGFFTGIDDEIRHYIHLGEFILSTPVLFYSGWIFFKGAYFGIKNRILNMDFLVSSGATLTYIYSLYILFGGKGESYFDSVSMIITFVLIGKYLEVLGKKSAVDTLDKIKSTIPLEALVLKDGTKKTISLNNIKIGDIIEIRSGEKVCIDGKILSGEGSFDESSLTGESIPIFKQEGDLIYSGTINNDALIKYEVIKTYKDSTLNSIVTLIEDSLSSKPDIEYKANEISKGFTISILSLSIITFIVWYFFGINLGFDYSDANHFEKSFIVAISVIVIACPCALALATPIASLIGISELAKRGLLFKEAKFLETIAKADTLVLDKTGTITKGELRVKKMRILDENIHKLNILYSLLDASTHPISKSIKKELVKKYDLTLKNLIEVKNIQAKGMKAKYKNVDGKLFDILGGNIQLLRDNKINYNFDSSNSFYLFCINKKVIATFELEDEIKNDAKRLVDYVTSNGLDVVMLTGDNEKVASTVSSKLGIKKYLFNIDPIGKAEYIKKLKKEGKIVIMAGDGINDSVALSNSSVSIAMGNSSDVTISVSDVVLLNNSLTSLIHTFKISKRTYKIIKQNLALSLIYNAITIPLAMFGFVIPLIAALSMSLSSLLVVANSMRIKKNN